MNQFHLRRQSRLPAVEAPALVVIVVGQVLGNQVQAVVASGHGCGFIGPGPCPAEWVGSRGVGDGSEDRFDHLLPQLGQQGR